MQSAIVFWILLLKPAIFGIAMDSPIVRRLFDWV
jgi:hypothetical protein